LDAFDITVEGERITIKNNGIVVINNALYPGLNLKGPVGFQHLINLFYKIWFNTPIFGSKIYKFV